MSISDEFAKLQTLHENGTLTDAEFAEAKAKVLAGGQPQAIKQTDAVHQDIQRLQVQDEILRLDQTWAAEREDYMLRRYGARIVPTVSGSSSSAIYASIVFVIFIVVGICLPRGEFLSGMGLLGIIASIISGFRGAAKADIYNTAYEKYQQKRDELAEQLRGLGNR